MRTTLGLIATPWAPRGDMTGKAVAAVVLQNVGLTGKYQSDIALEGKYQNNISMDGLVSS